MFPAKFAYRSAATVDEALALLEQGQGDAKILAGGHSLLPLMKLRLAQPAMVVDIGRIADLRYIRVDGETLRIGALTTYREIEHSDDVRAFAPVIAEAAAKVGDPQVRARGTLGGSMAHADPAADMPAVVLALGATILARGTGGERQIPIDEFFVDMLTTALGENDLVTEISFPRPAGERWGATYLKFDQPASHYALTGVCASVSLGAGGRIERARVGVTGVGPIAYRARAVEDAVVGLEGTDAALTDAVQSAAEGIDVQGDIHASPEYRAHLARVFTRRALVEAASRASASSR